MDQEVAEQLICILRQLIDLNESIYDLLLGFTIGWVIATTGMVIALIAIHRRLLKLEDTDD